MVNLRRMLFHNAFCGTLFILILWLSATLGTIFMNAVVLPLLLINLRLYRSVNDFFISIWLHLPVAMLELVFGIKFVVHSDPLPPGERSIIICNHRTFFDWLFYWVVLARQERLAQEKIVLKSQLKRVPGFGWAMQFASFIFISRQWEQDEVVLSEQLSLFAKLSSYPFQLFFFPEGTDFCLKSKTSSDKFADRNNLPKYEYVLYPRVRGFTFCVDFLRHKQALDAVYDVTVAYPCTMPTSCKSIAQGEIPEEVHFFIKRIPVQSLPNTQEHLENWLLATWQQKEERLKKFYEASPVRGWDADSLHDIQLLHQQQNHMSNSNTNNTTTTMTNTTTMVANNNNITQLNHNTTKVWRTCGALVYWSLYISIMIYFLWTSWFIRIWAIIFSVSAMILTWNWRGIEGFELFRQNLLSKDNHHPKSIKP